MEKEISIVLQLSKSEQTLLEMHSFLNVINVIISEIKILSMNFNKEKELKALQDHCISIARSLESLDSALESARRIDKSEAYILSELHKHIGADNKHHPDYEYSIDNITSIFRILNVRVREILNRNEFPQDWSEFNISNLKDNIISVFNAIELNSHGRYEIVYEATSHDINRYLIDIIISSVDGKVIKMPSVFQDVIRDLMANARKYTPPGGKIKAMLIDDGIKLSLAIIDNGIGVPESQIEKIMQFGFRGDNTVNKITYGGGFGLTKAYYITKRYNGRMWVDSELNKGTKIRIEIPRKSA